MEGKLTGSNRKILGKDVIGYYLEQPIHCQEISFVLCMDGYLMIGTRQLLPVKYIVI